MAHEVLRLEREMIRRCHMAPAEALATAIRAVKEARSVDVKTVKAALAENRQRMEAVRDGRSEQDFYEESLRRLISGK